MFTTSCEISVIISILGMKKGSVKVVTYLRPPEYQLLELRFISGKSHSKMHILSV